MRKTSYWSDTLPCLIAACTLLLVLKALTRVLIPWNQIHISSLSLMIRVGCLIRPIPLDVPIWMIVPFSIVVYRVKEDHPEGHVATRGDVSISWERYWTIGKTSPGSFAGNVSTVSPHRISGIPPTSESLRRIEGSVWTSRIG